MNSSQCKIVVPSDDPNLIGDSPDLDALQPYGEVVVYTVRPRDMAEQMERVQDADVIINSRGNILWRKEQLVDLPKLKMITTCAIGTDSIDLDVAKDLGIVVSNIPGRTAPVVAEHALAMILGVAKRLAYQTLELKSGRWTSMNNVYLAGKTLGVIGVGAIGSKVAKLAQAIGMKVVAWTFNPSADRADELGIEFVELDELLRQSDVISIHVRLSQDSHHLLGTRELQIMKQGSFLVNTARAGVVDTNAMMHALNEGHLGGVAMDVFDEEPLDPNHPLLDCDQVILSPHNADQTPEGFGFLTSGAVENVIAFLNGSPQFVVNP